MAAKKTFKTLHVRGNAVFDQAVTIRGFPVTGYKRWIGQVKYEEDQIVDVIELENTLGQSVVWTRDDAGVLKCFSLNTFPENQTVCFTNLLVGTIGDEFFLAAYRWDNDHCIVVIYNQQLTVSLGGYFFIEIRVYLETLVPHI